MIDEKEYNNAYNQGIDHAFRVAQTIGNHFHTTREFLIELFIQLQNLKDIQSKDITIEEVAQVINKN